MDRRHATVFLDNGNCEAYWVLHDAPIGGGYRSGFTERNIGELVQLLTGRGYFVQLFRVSNPTNHPPTTAES